MELTDPQAIRALAHPLRLDLVELLGQGPMTAAECARALGSTQASCSFHLRQLAKYGFVRPTPAGTDKRERRWELVDYEQKWSSADNPELTMALDQVFVRRESARLLDWTVRASSEPDEWRRASAFGGATVPLTPDEVTEVLERYGEFVDYLLSRFGDHIGERSKWPVGSRPVRLLFAATPLVDPLAPEAHPADAESPDAVPDVAHTETPAPSDKLSDTAQSKPTTRRRKR